MSNSKTCERCGEKFICHNQNARHCLDCMFIIYEEAIRQEEKVGEWVSEIGDCHSTGKYRVCTKCGGNVFIPYFSKQGIERTDFNYCPNCGCKMLKENE